jgi:hypothetical protein
MIRIKNSFGIARLPNEYQEVEYLELTGTQYINTGYTAPENSNVEVEIKTSTQIDGNGRRFLFGTRGGASFILWFGDYQNKLYYDFHYGTGSGSGSWINDYVNGTIMDIKMNSTGLYINGNTMDSSGAGTSFAGCTYPMYLGAIYTGSIMGYYGGRIYSCTIKNGSTPIRNFIPCYRKSDNIPGFYDMVNNQFYTNAGTGTFLVGKDANTKDTNIIPTIPVKKYFTEITYLPDEYQRVEYIESSATQYIDTGFVPTQNTRAEGTFAVTDTRTTTNIYPTFFGAQNLANASDNRNFSVGYAPSTKMLHGLVSYTNNTKYKIKLSVADGYCINDVKYKDYTWVGTPTVSLGLFTRKSSNNGFEACMQGTIRLYDFSLYENNVLIYNYIPCYRKSDNVIGLYDNINNVFHINQGTGTFKKGINLDNKETIEVKNKIPQEYQELDYIQSSGTQWIDTGVNGDGLGTFEIKFNTLGTMERPFEMYFAGRAATTTVKIYENAGDHNIVAQQDPNVWVLFPAIDTKDHVIKVSEEGIYKDGTKIVDYTPGAWGPKSYIIANSQDENIPASMKIYYLKMYTDGMLVRDYIPCYRKSDNVTGLYDLVNNQFYVSIGSENFIKGNEVAYLKMVNIPLKVKLLGNKVIYGGTLSNYKQLVNYTMLYDYTYNDTILNQCTEVSGGWIKGYNHSNFASNGYFLEAEDGITFGDNTSNYGCYYIGTKNKINFTDYLSCFSKSSDTYYNYKTDYDVNRSVFFQGLVIVLEIAYIKMMFMGDQVE